MASAIEVSWEGEGPPLVLVPGALSGPSVWRETARRHRDRFRVASIGLAGFAGVPPIDALLVPSARRELAELLCLVGSGDAPSGAAVVVGHSLGAFLAIGAALDVGARVRTVVAVDGVPALGALYVGRFGEPRLHDLLEHDLPGIATLDRPRFEAWVDRELLRLVRDPTARDALARDARRSDARTIANAMHTLYTSDLRHDLSGLAADLVAIVPDHFQVVGPEMERYLAATRAQFELAPKSTFVRIPDASHFPMIDASDAFFRVLTEVIGGDVGHLPTM